jgi:DNA-binding MarR family transcriptional regulator
MTLDTARIPEGMKGLFVLYLIFLADAKDGLTVSDLANQIGIRGNEAEADLIRLVRKGYVLRLPFTDPENRQHIYRLTNEGHRLLDRLEAVPTLCGQN